MDCCDSVGADQARNGAFEGATIATVIADLSPSGLLLLGPVLIALAVVHFRTAFWWYDWMTPGWRVSPIQRFLASTNRWGGAGFLVFIGVSSLAVGIARLG